MEVIGNVLAESSIDSSAAFLLAFLLVFVPAFPFLRRRIRAGSGPTLRSIPGFTILRGVTGQSLETGQRLHMSVGTQGIANQNAAQTLAGLTTLEYLARHAAVRGAPPVVSVADPTALIAAQDVLRHAAEERGEGDRCDCRNVRMIGPEPTVYAGGVMGILSREDILANVMTGAFGDEYLLMGETGVRRDIRQVAGSGNPQALPFMMTSADEVLIGEEMFAAGAYLSGLPSHIASLIIQDWMRTVIVAVVIVGVILSTVV